MWDGVFFFLEPGERRRLRLDFPAGLYSCYCCFKSAWVRLLPVHKSSHRCITAPFLFWWTECIKNQQAACQRCKAAIYYLRRTVYLSNLTNACVPNGMNFVLLVWRRCQGQSKVWDTPTVKPQRLHLLLGVCLGPRNPWSLRESAQRRATQKSWLLLKFFFFFFFF